MSSQGTKKGVWASVIVHVLFFGGLALMVAWDHFKPEEPEPVIFEMVEIPADATPAPPTPVEPDMPAIDAPDIAAPEQVDIPDLNIPEPEPEPVVETPPPPAPEPKPVETPKEKPQPKPEPQPISADEFFKQHGKPTPTPPRPVKPVDAPKINVDTSEALERLLNDTTSIKSSSPAQQQALLDYIARLRRQIELAWDKPSLATDAVARVRVTVQANGSLNPVLLIQSSGSAIFDKSIIDAVKSARTIGPPPTGTSQTINYTFRLTER